MPFPADKRLLNFNRGPNFTGLVQAFANRHDTVLAVAEAVRDGFDLDTAVGAQLDRLGGILQLARVSGQSDALYRLLLQVQVELILPSVGNPRSLLRIAELISGLPPTEYHESYVRTVRIGVEDISVPLIDLLVDRLQRARAAAVRIVLVLNPPLDEALLIDYTTAIPASVAINTFVDYTTADPTGFSGTIAYPMVF